MTASLEQSLGSTFSNPARLLEALTHSTFANENADGGPDNERLEFLGDAVLGLLVAAILFNDPADLGEGEMSRRRARVVRQSALAALARDLKLGDYVRLGVGQQRTGKTESILADAYEAVIGAVFIDGGFEAVIRCFEAPLKRALDAAQQRVDFKTRLQEVCHRTGLPIPEYSVLEVEGPDHAKRFSCEVKVGDRVFGPGEGRTKKAAEQVCARRAVEDIEAVARD